MNDQSHSNSIKKAEVITLKILGGIQIGFGIVCGCMSLAGIGLDVADLKECKNTYKYYDSYYSYYMYYYTTSKDCYHYRGVLLAFDIVCLLASGWFILTGLLPLFMTSTRQNKWRRLKISFMVFSIIGAALFASATIFMSSASSLIRSFDNDPNVAVSAILAVVGFVELVVAIVSASYSCCCSSLGSKISPSPYYVYIRNNDTGVIFGMPVSQIPAANFQSQNMSIISSGMPHDIDQQMVPPAVPRQQISQPEAQQGNHQMVPQPGPRQHILQPEAQQGNHQMVPQPGPSQQISQPEVQQGKHQLVLQAGKSQQISQPLAQHGNHQMLPKPGPSQQFSQLETQQGKYQIMLQPGPNQLGAQHGYHQMVPEVEQSKFWAQQGSHQMVNEPPLSLITME